MQLTYETAWYPTQHQQLVIQAHMTRYQIVKRFAYKRLKERHSRQVIKLDLLHRKLQKAQAASLKWYTHCRRKTLPPIVFGGKKNLFLYQNGKISKQEWKTRRNNGLYCIGEVNKRGNANLRLLYNSQREKFIFSMLLDQGQKNERLRASLYVPPKYQTLAELLAKGETKYTVRILKSTHSPFYRVLITVEHFSDAKSNFNGIAGIDINPMGIAVTVVYLNGNYRCSRWFPSYDLLYAQKNKRHWLIGNLVKKVLAWVVSLSVNTISVEDLRFSKQFGCNRKWNRIRSNFVYSRLLRILHSQAIKQQLCLRIVNPAYTSILGHYKYQKCYGMNNHQAAALIIARRGLGFNEKLYAHADGQKKVLVVPPMEGWTKKQILSFAREIDEFTAHLSNPTSKVPIVTPRLITRRKGSRGGIIPHNYTLIPGKGASVPFAKETDEYHKT